MWLDLAVQSARALAALDAAGAHGLPTARYNVAALRAAADRHAPTPDALPGLPPHWGGYRIAPERWEFWQGGEFRLHDRFEFHRSDPTAPWEIRRLQP